MRNLFEKYSKFILLMINFFVIASLIFIVEIVLRKFLPSQTATMGVKYSHNACLYGWGYNPRAMIKTSDPDTCDVWFSRVNNHGWRDLDREYENTKKAFRILIVGDSNTYGAIVPAESVYTRVLEQKLIGAGYNIEVINMGYGGWGTDQQLEALRNEGQLYKPDLIIVQWCSNDLKDITYFDEAINGSVKIEHTPLKEIKPFYYTIDNKDVITRHHKPCINNNFNELCWALVDNSEILKRLKEIYIRYRRQYVPCDSTVTFYKIGTKQIEALQTILGLTEPSDLLKFLKENVGHSITREKLANILSGYDEDTQKIVTKVLEDQHFWSSWTREDYELAKPDPNSYEWRLYFGLIREIKKIADKLNSDLAVFSATEEGQYLWELSWYWIKDDETSKKHFFERIELIKRQMAAINVDVIDNTIPYQRARNDFHPNIEGNKSMAEDIFKFLMTNYKDRLEAYRNPAR